ncbi:MAG: hypothetical protein A2268_14280 [Candidatus Raymondbacteria bacterium RifOxyA12_full_50_37]|uniref:Glycosyltransferase 2-like domain-containing protein n=1 Tax=Candidatus Raymondbacteria bacterium RIFOXYD12_FULL_49_13 TaxID=1817890 RepID=A0A1F7FLG3_UNCRA|nr:MAG: hypothetical protein A2268_14280 [Candidatus Raymondbacteria bacterium RifOxyA12_full_50_37]OGJ88247.1 MAG: hypothetical protein A2248_19620 [Candidatus Raymondbacteria bacterium RIFOXYA2_FULL_49_16]OGK07292.1 MAG: hypothetical protein A2519_14290 [Candidatus Raymondbacteria bacterium RIFOXYD12_FULL_49_13]OGP41061.1 MAG: hypothetical protein A2324_06245 [Candidatus Raymondbacteria bacterium RIFOXYB2_FULL_49_35]
MRRTISLCIIVKDEAVFLDRCLASYAGLADETIVVDTGSADGSDTVAARHGARVFHEPWEGDFSKARNQSLARATGDWIVWTDADDIVTPENREKIVQFRDAHALNVCFSFLIKNSQDGVLGSVFNQVRMFPRHNAIRFRNRVHEQVLPSIQELGFSTVYTDIMVVHTGYSSPEVVEKKQVRNLAILEDEMRKHPDHPVILFSYAGTLVDLKRHKEAVPWYLKAMELAEKQQSERHIYEGVPVALGALYGRLKEYGKARPWVDKAYALDPSHPQTNSMLGELAELAGDSEAAIRHFEFVLTCEEKPTFIPVDVNMLKINACAHLGGLYMKKGDKKKMVAILDKALEIKTGKKTRPSDRGRVFFDRGDFLQAGKEYLIAVNDPASDDWASFLGLAQVFLADNSPADAVAILTMGLERFPGNMDLVALRGRLKA